MALVPYNGAEELKRRKAGAWQESNVKRTQNMSMLAKHSQQVLNSLWNKYTVSSGACSPHWQQSGVRRQGGRFRQAGTVVASWNKKKGQRVFPQHQSKGKG